MQFKNIFIMKIAIVFSTLRWWLILYFTFDYFNLLLAWNGTGTPYLFNMFISLNHSAICHGILDIKNFNNLASVDMMIRDSQVHDTLQFDQNPSENCKFMYTTYTFISLPILKFYLPTNSIHTPTSFAFLNA